VEYQSKPERSLLARVIVWGLGILFGLFLLGAILNKQQDTSNTPDARQNTVTAPDGGTMAEQQPRFSVEEGNTTYYGVTSSDVGVAVLSIASGPYMLGAMSQPIGADGKFIMVTVAIFNGQNSAITMDTGLFEILDSVGNVYSASAQSMEVASASNLFLAQINPGVTKTGQIIFDVPKNLALDNLKLEFRGGMTGDSADIPLTVDSTARQMSSPSESSTETPQSSY